MKKGKEGRKNGQFCLCSSRSSCLVGVLDPIIDMCFSSVEVPCHLVRKRGFERM